MKDFVFHEEALELKKLGFDEPCFGFYTYKRELRRYTNFDGELNDFQTLKNSSITMGDGWCTAPTFSQSFRFFREKHDLQYWMRDGGYLGKCFIKITGYKHDKIYISSSEPMEYEEAELACLRKLIEIAKQKQ
jgi:hypothetical protein